MTFIEEPKNVENFLSVCEHVLRWCICTICVCVWLCELPLERKSFMMSSSLSVFHRSDDSANSNECKFANSSHTLYVIVVTFIRFRVLKAVLSKECWRFEYIHNSQYKWLIFVLFCGEGYIFIQFKLVAFVILCSETIRDAEALLRNN